MENQQNQAQVAVAIQARLGSSRLPGKVLRDLAGKPMFQQILEQVQATKTIQHFTLTTGDTEQDQPLIDFAKKQGLKVFQGPVDDIVKRLLGALDLTSAQYLVRIWGDCPFVCPDVIDDMVNMAVSQNLDYVFNGEFETRTYPPGLDLEVYSRRLLEHMVYDVKDPKLREYPLEYMKKHATGFKIAYHNIPENFSHLHLTVDYPEDLAAAEKMYRVLKVDEKPFTFEKLYPMFSQPEYMAGFSHQARNIEYHQYLSQKGVTK
jgi:spore coat polysaccharide biosynthesis protein SpsF